MKVFAIGDLHLSHAVDKPMDLFGAHWTNHWTKIVEDWLARVQTQDVVLIPGDISWGMHLNEALEDLNHIDELPGQKIIIKGNHDYWWSSLSKLMQRMPSSIVPIQNTCVRIDGHLICGTRGWSCPGDAPMEAGDEKIYKREAGRLELSLKAGEKLRQPGDSVTVMMHYPPFNEKQEPSLFTQIYAAYKVDKVIYGHLHGRALRSAFEGILEGVEYVQVSCDYLDFKLKQIW